jgi:hypothetical protein
MKLGQGAYAPIGDKPRGSAVMVIRSVVLTLCAVLTGCATSSVLVGTQRPEIPVEMVRVYLTPPANFEQVAILESSSEGSFALTAQQKTNKVMERLKEEAASLGANGILIQGIGSASRGAVINNYGNVSGGSYIGTGIAVRVMVKEGSAIAIYVPEQPGASEAQQQPTQPQPTSGCVACQEIGKDH